MEYCFNKIGDLLLKKGTKGTKKFKLGNTKFYFNEKCLDAIPYYKVNNNIVKRYPYVMEYLNQYNTKKIDLMINTFKKEKKKYKTTKKTIQGLSDEYSSLKVKDCKGYYCIELPKDYKVYKGMEKTDYKLNNIENPFSQGVGWFGPKEVAKPYAEEKNGKVYEYKTRRPLKLFVLGNKYNLIKLHNLILKRIENHLDKDRVSGKNIKKHIDEILALRMATGLLMSYDEQRKLIKNIYNRKIVPYKSDIVRQDINGEIYSPLNMDLNRESFRRLDSDLINAICSNLGFDGYINYNVPSIGSTAVWGIDYLPEEIGLCNQKGCLVEV